MKDVCVLSDVNCSGLSFTYLCLRSSVLLVVVTEEIASFQPFLRKALFPSITQIHHSYFISFFNITFVHKAQRQIKKNTMAKLRQSLKEPEDKKFFEEKTNLNRYDIFMY